MPRTNVAGTAALPDSGAQRCAQAWRHEPITDSRPRTKLQPVRADRADRPQPQKLALEKAAAELGTTPYWLRRELRHHGLSIDAFVDRGLFKALKQKRAALEETARALQSRHRAELRQGSQAASRPSRADHLDVMRRRDPELWRWNQEGPTQNIYRRTQSHGKTEEQAAEASRQRQQRRHTHAHA